MKLRLIAGALALALQIALSAAPALAQVNPGTSPLSIAKGGTGAATLTNHGVVVAHGTGPLTAIACTSAQLLVGQASADPICASVTGDVTISASGVTAIGASKVTNAQLATMAANTTKCNATAGIANPTDCTASTMRTNMGVVIGTNVEAWDADLDCLAALSSTGVISRTGAGTCSAGSLALSGLATGTQDTVIGYWGSTTATAIAINNCTGALTYSTSTHTFGCNVSAGTGTVTNVASGQGLTGGPCTTTCTLAISLTTASNFLGADVNLSTAGTYSDGPSMAQGTSGTWLVSGNVLLTTTNATGDPFFCKLYDGVTTYATGAVNTTTAAGRGNVTFVNVIVTSPASNLRIACSDQQTGGAGKINAANSGGSNTSSYITGVRIQ